jgi:hypothetical protein
MHHIVHCKAITTMSSSHYIYRVLLADSQRHLLDKRDISSRLVCCHKYGLMYWGVRQFKLRTGLPTRVLRHVFRGFPHSLQATVMTLIHFLSMCILNYHRRSQFHLIILDSLSNIINAWLHYNKLRPARFTLGTNYDVTRNYLYKHWFWSYL